MATLVRSDSSHLFVVLPLVHDTFASRKFLHFQVQFSYHDPSKSPSLTTSRKLPSSSWSRFWPAAARAAFS